MRNAGKVSLLLRKKYFMPVLYVDEGHLIMYCGQNGIRKRDRQTDDGWIDGWIDIDMRWMDR